MIEIEDIKYISLAGILKSFIEQLAGIAFSLIIFIAVVFIIIPVVGLPLALLLRATSGVFGIGQEMAQDIVGLMTGGVDRALPMIVALVLIGIVLRLWHLFLESRHGWLGLAVIVFGSLGCLFILVYVANVTTGAFGSVWGTGLGLLGAPVGALTALGMAVPFLVDVSTWLNANIIEGTWTVGTTDIGQAVGSMVLFGLSTYVFYSLLASGALVLAGAASSPLYRAARRFELQAGTRARMPGRFRLAPTRAALGSVLLIMLRALVSSVIAGVIVFLVYQGTYLLVSNSRELSVRLVTAAGTIGLEGNAHVWLGANFILASSVMCVAIIGWLACARVLGTRFATGPVIEWLVVLLASMAIYVAAANIGVGGDNAAIAAWLGVPILLIFLFARQQVWRAFHESADRIRSSQQRSVEEVIRSDDVHPILYLRAFIDDSLTVGRGFRLVDLLMGMPVRTRRFEELVAGRGFLWRPIVALGNPHIPFSLHGVLKKDVSNEGWQAEVEYWHKRCAYVLMIANKTENIAWEIDLIRRTRGSDSSIFVVTSVERAREFFDHYEIIPGQPKVPDGALVVYRDSARGWVAITSPIRTEVAYSTALDIALARTEGGIATMQ